MNPFLMTPDERLADWKVFRNGLKAMDRREQLQAVATYWAQAPLMKMAYDVFELDDIPGPWELVSDGDWCRDTVAVGMEFTLRLAGWRAEDMTLMFIRDYEISEQMLVLKIDTGEVLNYSVGQVIDFPETRHDVLLRWRYNGRTYKSEN